MNLRLILITHRHVQGEVDGRAQTQLFKRDLCGAFTLNRLIGGRFGGGHGTIVPSHVSTRLG